MTRVDHVAVALAAFACLSMGAIGPASAMAPQDATDSPTENITTVIDCENGTVAFSASNETDYVASVTVVNISSTETSSARQTRTVSGNATFNTSTGDVVATFVSTDALGDDTISQMRVCRSNVTVG